MKRLAFAFFLLAGCAGQSPIAEPPRNHEEAYLYARSGYEVALEQMVQYRDECFSRPAELVEECRPTVERMRNLAKDGRKYLEVMDSAYRIGDVTTFEGGLKGLQTMQSALKAEIMRQAAKQKENQK